MRVSDWASFDGIETAFIVGLEFSRFLVVLIKVIVSSLARLAKHAKHVLTHRSVYE